MGYRIYDFGGKRKSADMREFEEAMEMAKEGMERICSLAEEMVDQYGERRGSSGNRSNYRGGGSSGGRGGYGERERESYRERDMWDDEEEMMGERRRRDGRGRYM